MYTGKPVILQQTNMINPQDADYSWTKRPLCDMMGEKAAQPAGRKYAKDETAVYSAW